MNLIWTLMIAKAVKEARRVCTGCQKPSTYVRKQAGQFYTCKHCGHRFKEKAKLVYHSSNRK